MERFAGVEIRVAKNGYVVTRAVHRPEYITELMEAFVFETEYSLMQFLHQRLALPETFGNTDSQES